MKNAALFVLLLFVCSCEQAPSVKRHAMLIGINAYDPSAAQPLTPLDAARPDAEALAEILSTRHGYTVELLLDEAATHEAMTRVMGGLAERSDIEELIFFYAGHGMLDKETRAGFWLPADADAEDRSRWIAHEDVRRWFDAVPARRVLVIADSCFGGALMKGGEFEPQEPVSKKAYEASSGGLFVSSGGLRPVPDQVGSRHSFFTRQLLKTLKQEKPIYLSQAFWDISLEMERITRQIMMVESVGDGEFALGL